jgi:hypothetical protein
MTNYSECPNLDCQAQWGIEEISFQECDCCGWPNCDDEKDYDTDYDTDYD